MKLLIVLTSIIVAIHALSDEELWMKFKQDHGKTYKSLREEKLRYDIFKSNLRVIEEQNAKYETGEDTWFMGINQFSDMTDEEFEAEYLRTVPENIEFAGTFDASNASIPDAIDWRTKGAVLSVKDQGDCGSCWAFSAVASIEGQNAIKHGKKDDLSPQELVDCSWSFANHGCRGGWMNNGFRYAQTHGLSTLAEYPYTGLDGKCKLHNNGAGIKVTDFKVIERNEEDLKAAVGSVGPISIAINGSPIRHYAGGVFNNPACKLPVNHGVLAVGYGTEGDSDFWIVKNSWGKTWGDNGYIKMSRNRNAQCGITYMASYPILE